MLSGKYTPLDEIIERAYRETGRETIDWNDAIVWIGDALDLIGVPDQYIDRITNGEVNQPEPLQVINFRTVLPADFFSLVAIREFTCKIPLQKSFGTFTQSPTDNQYYDSAVCDPQTVEDFGGTDYTSVTNFNNIDMSYTINNHFIFTTFETGQLEMAYKAFPVDDRGFPLIPDNTKYRLALQNYVCAKIAHQEWIKDPNSSGKKAIYNSFDAEASWYMGAAQTNAVMPDLSTMESIKNNWMRSIIKIDQFDTGFKYMNKAERRRIV